MNRPLVRSWIATALAVTISAGRGAAQQPRLADGVPASAPRSVESVFARPVTVQLDGVTLRRAINSIAISAGVRIQYFSDALDAFPTPITLHAKNLSLGIVLDRVLAGTGLHAVPYTENIVTLKAVADATAIVQGVITGTVVDAKKKQPVVGATVLLDNETKGVVTGEDGTFRLPARVGNHTVQVRRIGMSKQTQRVTITEGQTVTLAFELEPSTSVLDEVVVTGSVVETERKAIPTPITVITADDIEKQNITRLEQLFRGEVPSIVAIERGTQAYANQLGGMVGSRVYSRGSASLDGSPNPIKTYIDGVEIMDAAYLGTIDPKSIEKIEIITGPQAATIYGSGAIGGVMQIFTKKGSGRSAPDLTLNLRYGLLESNLAPSHTPSHNHALLMAGGSGPEFSYSGNLSYQYTGQWQPALFNRSYGASLGAVHTRGPIVIGGSVSNSNSKNGTQGSGGGYIFSGAGWSQMATLFEKQFREMGEQTPTNGASYYTQNVSRAASQNLALNVDYRPFTLWQHHVTVGKNQNDFSLDPVRPIFSTPGDSLFRTQFSSGERTTLNYNMTVVPRMGWLSSTMTVGGSLSMGKQTTVQGCLPQKSSTTYVGCSRTGSASITKTLDDKSWGGFGSFQFGVLDRLYLTVALRAERNPNYGENHKIDLTPTEGVTYTIEYGDLTLKLLGSYGRATRAPTSDMRKRFYYTDPSMVPMSVLSQVESDDLTPEYSRGPQGGFELYYGNLGSITLNHYNTKVTNLIQSVPAAESTYVDFPLYGYGYYMVPTQYLNVANLRQRGWASTASVNLGALSLKGTYSWDDSRVSQISPRVIAVQYRPEQAFYGIPTHTANVTASYARGGTSVTWVTNYVGSTISDARWKTPAQFLSLISRIQVYQPRIWELYMPETIQGYAKSDLAVSHQLTPWISGTLNVTNVGDNYGSDVTALFPSLGRQTLVGVSIRYPRPR